MEYSATQIAAESLPEFVQFDGTQKLFSVETNDQDFANTYNLQIMGRSSENGIFDQTYNFDLMLTRTCFEDIATLVTPLENAYLYYLG